jgi:hypothetical protein
MDIKMNKEVKNHFFKKKQDDKYKHSNMPINQDLKTISDWTGEEIKKREEKYFEIAKEIWKINF